MRFLDREKPDVDMQHCWAAMNPGSQGLRAGNYIIQGNSHVIEGQNGVR